MAKWLLLVCYPVSTPDLPVKVTGGAGNFDAVLFTTEFLTIIGATHY